MKLIIIRWSAIGMITKALLVYLNVDPISELSVGFPNELKAPLAVVAVVVVVVAVVDVVVVVIGDPVRNYIWGWGA